MNKRSLVLIFSLIISGFFFQVKDAFSYDWEFITYGGYNAAVEAWKRVALIFSDSGFKGLIFVAVVLGALILFYAFLARAAFGARIDPVRNWLVPVFLGMIVATALILPKDSVIIYDEVLERGPYRVNGVPRILGFLAHITNKIEKGFIDIIDTSVIDINSKYSYNAGGINYRALKNLHSFSPSDSLFARKKYIIDSLTNYWNDCILFEISRSNGATINPQMLFSGQITGSEIINRAKNPSVYTKLVNSDGSVTEGISCEDAGNTLISWLNTEFSGSYTAANLSGLMISGACSEAGYGGSSASLSECANRIQSLLNEVSSQVGVPSPGLQMAAYQYFLATVFKNAVLSGNPNEALAVLASSQTMSTMWGLGEHANSWIVILKEALTALAIGISPFILLLAVTPLAGRALSLLAGLFVWLLCWGVIDAVIFTFGRELASAYVSALGPGSSYGWGFALAMAMPSYSAKMVAIFGALRWAGLGLATVFASMLVRFGGAALAMVAGSIAGIPQGAGAAYGSLARTPGSVLYGEVLPAETMGSSAIAMGGFGNLYSGLKAHGVFSTVSQATAGNIVESQFSGGAARAGLLAGSTQATRMLAETYAGSVFKGREGEVAYGLGILQGGQMLGQARAASHFTAEQIADSAYKSTYTGLKATQEFKNTAAQLHGMSFTQALDKLAVDAASKEVAVAGTIKDLKLDTAALSKLRSVPIEAELRSLMGQIEQAGGREPLIQARVAEARGAIEKLLRTIEKSGGVESFVALQGRIGAEEGASVLGRYTVRTKEGQERLMSIDEAGKRGKFFGETESGKMTTEMEKAEKLGLKSGFRYGQFIASGGVIFDEMAQAFANSGDAAAKAFVDMMKKFKNATAYLTGFTFNPDTGQISNISIRANIPGIGRLDYGGGFVTGNITIDPKSVQGREAYNFLKSLQGIPAGVNAELSRYYKQGTPFSVSYTMDPSTGKIATISVQSGGGASRQDVVERVTAHRNVRENINRDVSLNETVRLSTVTTGSVKTHYANWEQTFIGKNQTIGNITARQFAVFGELFGFIQALAKSNPQLGQMAYNQVYSAFTRELQSFATTYLSGIPAEQRAYAMANLYTQVMAQAGISGALAGNLSQSEQISTIKQLFARLGMGGGIGIAGGEQIGGTFGLSAGGQYMKKGTSSSETSSKMSIQSQMIERDALQLVSRLQGVANNLDKLVSETSRFFAEKFMGYYGLINQSAQNVSSVESSFLNKKVAEQAAAFKDMLHPKQSYNIPLQRGPVSTLK